jgi:hypothetical protein
VVDEVAVRRGEASRCDGFVSGPFGTVQGGGLSAGGCNGSGSGFFCSGGTGLAIGPGKVYNWEWAITLASPGDLFTGSDAASIKASFVTPAGGNGGLTSEDITLQPGSTPSVPEPTTLTLLGTGALGLAGVIKRRLA